MNSRPALLPLTLAPLTLVLAACQTVPSDRGLGARQVAVLQHNGFVQSGDDRELGMSDRLLFPVDGSLLVAGQQDRILRLAGALAEVGIHGARIEGNTDSTGSAAYNQQLSERRAAAVRQALVSGGLAAGGTTAVGLGATRPIETNRTVAGRQENRRVVIIISPGDGLVEAAEARR